MIIIYYDYPIQNKISARFLRQVGLLEGTHPRIIPLGISWYHPTFPEDFCYQPPVGTARPARKGGRGELCNQAGGVREGLLGLGRGGSQQPPSG